MFQSIRKRGKERPIHHNRINDRGGSMNKIEALDWALTYLREALGQDIEDNQEYQEAVKTLKEAV